MNACRDANDIFNGDFAIHSDAPVTPLAPLVTAWCAVNRITESGRVLGSTQQITIEQALRCITLGAAYILKLEREIGSIETGKKADFCIIDQDPLTQKPEALRNIEVIDTVFAGVPTSTLKPIHSF
jgi:predicted amidohydrolase YtcJ